jgi:hypothetical protein
MQMRSMRAIGLVLVPLVVLGACNMPGNQTGKANAKAKTPVAGSGQVAQERILVDIDSGAFAKTTLHQEQEPSKLEPKENFVRVISLKDRAAPANATYVYRVGARSLQADVADMRLQAVWLPEGGWDAKDAQGESLVQVDAVHVQPVVGQVDTFELQLRRPMHAVELRVFVHNEGVGPIAVNGLSVLEAWPKKRQEPVQSRIKSNG